MISQFYRQIDNLANLRTRNIVDETNNLAGITESPCPKDILKIETIKEDVNNEVKTEASTLCVLCGKNYPSRKRMKVHIRRYHIVDIVKCEICKKQISGKKRLENHMRIHNPKVECSGCNQWFTDRCVKTHQLQCLNIVKRDKRKNDNHMCLYCDKRFPNKQKLRLHTKIHVKHKCQDCDKFFKKEQTLERHRKRMHAPEEKPKVIPKYNQCDECQYKTKWRKDLKRHSVVHTRSRLLLDKRCTDCGHQFTRHSGLKRHKVLKHCKKDSSQLHIGNETIFLWY